MGSTTVKILFFAKARELVLKDSDTILLFLASNGTTGEDILNQVLVKYPALTPISKNIVLAINQEYVELEQLIEIESKSEIAIIPPLSGG